MWPKVCLVPVLVFAVAATAAAQIASETQLFPVAGNPPTSWRSDLTVHNLMHTQLSVSVVYFPSGQANQLDGGPEEVLVLQPRETRTVEDVVATLFGIESNSKGALYLECTREVAFPHALVSNRSGGNALPDRSKKRQAMKK